MSKNASPETKTIWHFVRNDHCLNAEVSKIVIRCLKKSTVPEIVCKKLANELQRLLVKKCNPHNFVGQLALFSFSNIDFDILARWVMHEVIFGEEVAQ